MSDASQMIDGSPGQPEALAPVERHRRLEDAALVAGRLAHDFGNVLTGILGFTELALSQMQPTSTAYRYLQEGYRTAQLGTQMIQQLRLFSRRGPLTETTADLREVGNCLRERFLGAGQAERLSFSFPNDLPKVAVDGPLLATALELLVDNAVEAIAEDGRINVTARSSTLSEAEGWDLVGKAVAGPCVEVRVADDGCGIPEEVRCRLLVEPFLCTKARHRGLGLAVVYSILRSHRGALRIESTPGQGTTVSVYLPQVPVSGRAPVDELARPSGQGLENTVHAPFPDQRFDGVSKPIRSERLPGTARSALEHAARLPRPA